MNDFVILDIAIHLAASKNSKYRESVRRYFKNLITFLQENGLTTKQLLSSETPADDFRIVTSDLTEEGFQFIKKGLDKWTTAVEDGNPVDDTSILREELKKLRQ